MGVLYGYCRISTSKQSIERQERNILRIYPDAVIIKEIYTGTSFDRPKWNWLMKVIKEDDAIVFDEVSRMGRNAAEGYEIYKELFEKGINLIYLKESHINTESYRESLKNVIDMEIRSGDPDADELVNAIVKAVKRFALSKVEKDIYKAFDQAEKEVDYLHRRTQEGIEMARLNGKKIGIKKGTKLVTRKSVEAKRAIRKYNKAFGGPLNNIETIRQVGISETSFYKYRKEIIEEIAMERGFIE